MEPTVGDEMRHAIRCFQKVDFLIVVSGIGSRDAKVAVRPERDLNIMVLRSMSSER